MQSTHDEVVAKLTATEKDLQKAKTNLQATQMAKKDLEDRYTESQAANVRLRSGLEALIAGFNTTVMRVQTVGASIQRLRTEGSNVAARLSELQTLVNAQVGALTALDQALEPLKAEIEAFRAKLTALSGPPAAPAPVPPGPTTPPSP